MLQEEGGGLPVDLGQLLTELVGNCLRAPPVLSAAGEGELVFGLTKHRAILPERGLASQWQGFGRVRLELPVKRILDFEIVPLGKVYKESSS